MRNDFTVNLVIALPKSGKTRYILEQILKSVFAVVVPDEERISLFNTEYASLLQGALSTPIIFDEKTFETRPFKTKLENIFITELSAWDENDPRHLDLFLSLAKLAQRKSSSIWAELTASSANELALIQNAVKAMVAMNIDVQFTGISLSHADGIHLSYSANQLLSASRKFPQNEIS